MNLKQAQIAMKKATLEAELELKACRAADLNMNHTANDSVRFFYHFNNQQLLSMYIKVLEEFQEEEEKEIPELQLQQLADALKTLSSDSALQSVKELLDEFKTERQEYKEVCRQWL